MVAVKGFPRPLYPPDAKGYTPSVDGPDVEAYKRTVSRLGRWVWQAFDQAYSNGFAHGKGGNLQDTGMEGFQRQMKLEATGNVGEKTFNALRSARVPEGKPHAGEMAMDARAAELIDQAWERFKGKPAPPEPTTPGSAAQARLKKAQAELGKKESPANSNRTPYGAWYGMDGQPWCAMFCCWADQLGGKPTQAFKKGSRYAYVPYIVQDARYGLNGLSVTSSPKPGDLVCFDWDRDGTFDHVGVFESGNAQTFKAVEGNTSTSNNSNGGEVMRRDRSTSQAAIVFVRVKEP